MAPKGVSQPSLVPDARTWAAIDFETANTDRTSACAVAVVLVRDGHVVARTRRLLRPPTKWFTFSHLHGITWADVRNAPTFAQAWPQLASKLEGTGFVAAHNAGFDRSVLLACCAEAGLAAPLLTFLCTVRLARASWKLSSHRLPVVCEHLGISLDHHDPLSDATAAARIVLAARAQGRAGDQ